MFPTIKHIDDVLPHINEDLFTITNKNGYTVINYNIVTPETFSHPDPLTQSIRRECRGIIFDSNTGKILRRPLHKFFNYHEPTNEYTDLSDHHVITEKLDGSMIAPFFINDYMRLGTKMGITNVSMQAEEFISTRPEYTNYIIDYLYEGITPVFEWCSKQQRIVLDYEEDQLVLLACRNMHSGEYENYEILKSIAESYSIPVVNIYNSSSDMNAFMEYTRTLEDSEGFVIILNGGGHVKIKSDWYCRIHKALEGVRIDRNIVALILDNQLDDVYSMVTESLALPIREFESKFWENFEKKFKQLYDYCIVAMSTYEGNPKRVALEYNIDQMDKYFVFKHIKGQGSLRANLIDYISNNIRSGGKYKTLMDWLDPEETTKL